jgi:hypothetical protein
MVGSDYHLPRQARDKLVSTEKRQLRTEICTAMKADPALAKAVGVIGLHYPSDFQDLGVCDALGKPIWASEESSSYDDLNGAACW